jgi:hypothetical protein
VYREYIQIRCDPVNLFCSIQDSALLFTRSEPAVAANGNLGAACRRRARRGRRKYRKAITEDWDACSVGAFEAETDPSGRVTGFWDMCPRSRISGKFPSQPGHRPGEFTYNPVSAEVRRNRLVASFEANRYLCREAPVTIWPS